jgi:hypothetical protein
VGEDFENGEPFRIGPAPHPSHRRAPRPAPVNPNAPPTCPLPADGAAPVEHVWIIVGADGHFHGGIFTADERPQWIKYQIERQDRECDVDGTQVHRVVEFAPAPEPDRAPAEFMQLLNERAAAEIAAMSPEQRAEFKRNAARVVQILQHDAPAAPLTCCEGDHYKVSCLGCGMEFIVHDDTVVESLTTITRAWCPACVQAGKHIPPAKAGA